MSRTAPARVALAALQGHRAPRWMQRPGSGDGAWGGNLQTIVSARLSRTASGPPAGWRRQRWTTPDGDFIDVDFAERPSDSPGAHARLPAAPGAPEEPPPSRPKLVLFHGLEGHSDSHYARAFASVARERGWAFAVPHFRGCSGELNLAPRAYHSGDHEEIGWILDRLHRAWDGAPDGECAAVGLRVVGISLGGNALLRWAEEAGETASAQVQALAALSSPIDLAAGGHALARGFNRQVYTRMFLATMRPKALRKWAQHPGLFDRERLRAARTLYDFDQIFTAPLHGFRDTDDYWSRASAAPHLHRIRVPSLVLNARNDPFVPAASLPRPGSLPGPWVQLLQPDHGGHLGFATGRLPGDMRPFARSVCDWLDAPTTLSPELTHCAEQDPARPLPADDHG